MTGWRCPSCSRCWAPHVNGCEACNKAATLQDVVYKGSLNLQGQVGLGRAMVGGAPYIPGVPATVMPAGPASNSNDEYVTGHLNCSTEEFFDALRQSPGVTIIKRWPLESDEHFDERVLEIVKARPC